MNVDLWKFSSIRTLLSLSDRWLRRDSIGPAIRWDRWLSTPLPRRPLEQKVNVAFTRHAKAQAMIKIQGSIEPFHVSRDSESTEGCFGHDVLEQGRSHPPAAIFRQQSNIDHPDFIFPPVQVKPSNGLIFEVKEQKLGSRELLLVIGVLGVELHPEEGLLLRRIPVEWSQLLFPGTGINMVQERFVFGGYGAKRNGATHVLRSSSLRLPPADRLSLGGWLPIQIGLSFLS